MMNTDTRLAILNDSDTRTCTHGCGCAEPLPENFHVNAAWFADIVQTPDALIAEVTCPRCLYGECNDA